MTPLPQRPSSVVGAQATAFVATTTEPDEAVGFGSEFRLAGRAAYLLARQLGCSPDEAADVVQDAGLRAWRYRSTRRGDFRPWFSSIVYRQALRRRTRWLPLAFVRRSEGTPTPPPESMDPELSAALQRLSERHRAALWLRYAQDMSTAARAQSLGTTETAAKQLLLRARDALRHQLADISTETTL